MDDNPPNLIQLVILCEGPTDSWVAQELADRVFRERGPDWVKDVGLDALRRWSGLEPNTTFTPWRSVKDLAGKTGIRYLGHPVGQPQKEDAAITRKAIHLARRLRQSGKASVDALILVRDVDKREGRIQGVAQAVDEENGKPEPLVIVVAFAVAMIEAWILNGFAPRDATEARILEALRAELGFDPCLAAHRLDARSHGPPSRRSAKRVLHELTGGDRDRQRSCLQDTPLDHLESRGAESGLAPFLGHAHVKLTPVVVRGDC